ncbi:MAG: acetolactate decarboxylase [Sedimentisphaeraceae bacterium JB056]
MKICRFIVCLAFAVCVCFSCGCQQRQGDVITQASTIDALLAGSYGGFMTLDELEGYGDTGIGTFDSLDGEMAMIDGVIYQVRYDGSISRPQDSVTTPFASVLWFESEDTLELSGCDYDSLQEQIAGLIGSDNVPAAIVIEGRFSYVHTRSVPPQKKPYPPLVEVAKNQPEFTAENIKGRLVGFCLQQFVGKINVPGFHLHFISEDKSFGGHLLDIKVENATAEIDRCSGLNVRLPINDQDFADINLEKDRSGELEKSEKKRGS